MVPPANKNKITSPPPSLKETIQKLIEEGCIADARQSLQQYMEENPHDLENFSLAAVILTLEGKLAEAEKVLLEGLRHNPEDCDLLFNLGFLDEQQQEYINALDLYKRAELAARTPQQKEDIDTSLERVRQNIRGKVVFKEDSYSIILEGNREPLKLDYELNRLLERKQLLDAIVQNMDHRAKTAMEVELDDWVIAKNLANMGLSVKAFAPDAGTILKSIGVEFQEKMRKSGPPPPKYYQLKTDVENASRLPESDVIILLPGDSNWYREKGRESAVSIIKTLAQKARRQLFYSMPSMPEMDETAAFFINALKDTKSPGNEPMTCWDGAGGTRLYRLDTGPRVKTNPPVFISRGIDAVHSNKAVFEVDVEKCRDLNGMAYTDEGWNHFVVLLKQLKQYPELAYEDSVLKAYYERFTPRNRQQQLFPDEQQNILPLCDGWTILPWMDARGLQINATVRPDSRSGGNHHHGPNTDDFGRRELDMIKVTYFLIKRFGYHPEIFPDGYIQGYFLKKGKDYRFMVNEGQHRIAAVAVQGYDVIKCKHNPKFPRVADVDKIKQWPQVKSGLYSRELAAKVFLYYFENNGREKAEHLGLVKTL